MCGICGIVRFDGKPVDRSVLKAMNDKLVHRGPDDEGFHVDDSIGLACRRLSIIDVAGGHQPITTTDGNYTVIQNGEIYNYLELRAGLENQGYVFHTKCDTEVILNSYVAWGADCISRLNGMFGVAIHDKAKGAVVIARDRAGIKPLFYFRSDRFIAFASEIKSLLAIPGVPRKPDTVAMDLFLKYKYIPGERTMFQGISKLAPACSLEVSTTGRVDQSLYWELTPESFSARSSDSPGKELREALFKTVERQMISDVPLGALLSGGIDSTIIAGIMAKLAPGRVKTFCMGFREKSFNETPFARIAADFHGTEHHEFICEAENLMELVPELVSYFDEPLGDASMIPTYLVARETRKFVTVALAGTGADELFGGYDRYRVQSYLSRYGQLPGFVKNGIIPALMGALRVTGEKKDVIHRAKRFLRVVGMPAGKAYEDLIALFPGDDRRVLFSDRTRAELQGVDVGDVAGQVDKFSDSGLDFLQCAMYADLATILPGDYLMKDDRMSMACSLEVRVPFLDHEIVELAARVPSVMKMRKGTAKFIPRETFADMIPPALRERGKYGFESPISLWMEGARLEGIRSMLTSKAVADRGIMDVGAINSLVNRHAMREENCMNQIFSLLVLEFWFKRYID